MIEETYTMRSFVICIYRDRMNEDEMCMHTCRRGRNALDFKSTTEEVRPLRKPCRRW